MNGQCIPQCPAPQSVSRASILTHCFKYVSISKDPSQRSFPYNQHCLICVFALNQVAILWINKNNIQHLITLIRVPRKQMLISSLSFLLVVLQGELLRATQSDRM